MSARCCCAIAALALAACATPATIGEAPRTATGEAIAPYGFLEHCADLATGDRLDFRFETKAPVHFEIYYKDGIAFISTITREEVTEDSGIFRATSPRRYCARWEAGRDGALIDYRLGVVRAGKT